MNMLKKFVLFSLIAIGLTACGKSYEIPPAHVGKIYGSTGPQEGILKSSKGRLPMCVFICDNIVLLEASDQMFKEDLEIFMPQDKLLLQYDVRGIVQIDDDNKDTINRIFDRVTASDTAEERIKRIDLEQVYQIYVQNNIRTITRSVLSKYTIAQVLENPDMIAKEMQDQLNVVLKNSPVKVIQFGVARLTPPKVIIAAQETAQERRIQIERAQAEKEILLKRAEADYEVAEKDRAIRILKARTTKEENEIIAASVTPQWIQFRNLEVMESIGKSESTVFFPYQMMDSVGLNNRVMNTTGGKQ